MLRSKLQFAAHKSWRLMKRFWREDGGFLISTEWLFWATIVAIGTITAVILLRTAGREVFTGVAVDIAKEQPYTFDRPGFVGHQSKTTPASAAKSFEKLGEKPGETWESPPGDEQKGSGKN